MNDGASAEPSTAVASPQGPMPPELDGLRAALYKALASKHALLGQMYLGAVAALDRGDTESLAQCGHSTRELLEKLPTFFEGVPQERGTTSLGEAARTLTALVEQTKKNSKCWEENKWQGEIDSSLRKLLGKGLGAFTDVVASMRPPRRTERAGLLRQVDDSPLPMSPVVEKLRITEWEEYIGFFQGIAHHTREADVDEVRSMMRQCEQFLLDRLVPRTFEDRAEIAAIVAEVERGH